METIENSGTVKPSVDAFGIKITDTTAKILVVIAAAYLLQNLGIFDVWNFVKGGLTNEAAE